MKYFNNICLDCRERRGARNESENPKCNVYNIENPTKLIDYDLEDKPLAVIDLATSEEALKQCSSFNDRHEARKDLYCDYGKYGNEMNVLHRLTMILNHNEGKASFEGAMLDYLRNNTNDRKIEGE